MDNVVNKTDLQLLIDNVVMMVCGQH